MNNGWVTDVTDGGQKDSGNSGNSTNNASLRVTAARGRDKGLDHEDRSPHPGPPPPGTDSAGEGVWFSPRAAGGARGGRVTTPLAGGVNALSRASRDFVGYG